MDPLSSKKKLTRLFSLKGRLTFCDHFGIISKYIQCKSITKSPNKN